MRIIQYFHGNLKLFYEIKNEYYSIFPKILNDWDLKFREI